MAKDCLVKDRHHPEADGGRLLGIWHPATRNHTMVRAVDERDTGQLQVPPRPPWDG